MGGMECQTDQWKTHSWHCNASGIFGYSGLWHTRKRVGVCYLLAFQALEKNIRKNIETELRARATDEGKPMATSAGTSSGAAAKKRGKKGAKSKK